MEEQRRSARSWFAHKLNEIGATSIYSAKGWQLDMLASAMGIYRDPRAIAASSYDVAREFAMAKIPEHDCVGCGRPVIRGERVCICRICPRCCATYYGFHYCPERIRGQRCEQMIIDDPYTSQKMVRTDREHATMVYDTPNGPIYLRPQTMQELIDGPVSELNKRDGYDNQEDNVKQTIEIPASRLQVGDIITHYWSTHDPSRVAPSPWSDAVSQIKHDGKGLVESCHPFGCATGWMVRVIRDSTPERFSVVCICQIIDPEVPFVAEVDKTARKLEKWPKIEDTWAKIDEAQKARDVVAEQPPRKTIDELLGEMRGAMIMADIKPHPEPEAPYSPHFLYTNEHRKAWKTRLARLQWKAREKEQHQVLVDREFEDWE